MKQIFALIPLVLLTACGGKPEPTLVAQQSQPTPAVQQSPQQPPQQVIVQQAPQQSHDSGLLTGAVMGMALGHMMSNSSNNSSSAATNVTRNTTIVNKTVVVQQAPKAVPPTPAPVARPAPSVQRATVSSPSRSISSGKR
jgi:predicted lipid-binding transport protein (Tim44 family)